MTMTVNPLPPLSPRFGVVSALPTVVLVGWVAFLWGSGAVIHAPNVKPVFAALGAASVAQVTLTGILGVALGSVLHPFQFVLVRLLEGYWRGVPGLRRLQYLGMEINRRRMRRLRRAGLTRDLAEHYPPDTADLLPTAVGNAMRSAERRAGLPYGMDAVLMLPRLYPLASPTVSAVFEDLRNQLDVAARYCVVLGLMTISGFTALATDGSWLLLPLATGAMTWACYRATLRTALSYGKGLRVLFDLHHADLVLALGWRVPPDVQRLTALTQELQKWLVGGGPPPAGYVGPSAAAADTACAEAVAKGIAEAAVAISTGGVPAEHGGRHLTGAGSPPDVSGASPAGGS
jgi:hypothetical protein